MAVSEFKANENPSRANFNTRIREMNAGLDEKQVKIQGEPGQMVGFDADGNPEAQNYNAATEEYVQEYVDDAINTAITSAMEGSY